MQTAEFLFYKHEAELNDIVDKIMEHYYVTGELEFTFDLSDYMDYFTEEEIQRALETRARKEGLM